MAIWLKYKLHDKESKGGRTPDAQRRAASRRV